MRYITFHTQPGLFRLNKLTSFFTLLFPHGLEAVRKHTNIANMIISLGVGFHFTGEVLQLEFVDRGSAEQYIGLKPGLLTDITLHHAMRYNHIGAAEFLLATHILDEILA